MGSSIQLIIILCTFGVLFDGAGVYANHGACHSLCQKYLHPRHKQHQIQIEAGMPAKAISGGSTGSLSGRSKDWSVLPDYVNNNVWSGHNVCFCQHPGYWKWGVLPSDYCYGKECRMPCCPCETFIGSGNYSIPCCWMATTGPWCVNGRLW